MMTTQCVDHRALLLAYRENGDQAARDRLIEAYLPLVRVLARRYAGRGEQLDDLVQVGAVGLIKAVDRFDLSRDVAFTTYAVPTVVGEIKRHFRDRVWMVTVPRRLKELYLQLARVALELTAELGRAPTIAELAKAVGTDDEEVVEAMSVGYAYTANARPAGGDGDDGDLPDPIDLIPDVDEAYEASENRLALAAGFRVLDPRERHILHLRYYEGRTQSQIGLEVGVSQMHVSRLIRRALEKLQDELEEI